MNQPLSDSIIKQIEDLLYDELMEDNEPDVPIIPTYWIHLGHQEITPQQFDKIQNVPLSPKPEGGLWASPLQLDGDFLSDWHKYCMNVWGRIRKNQAVVFTLKKNARIYVIHKQKDLLHLIEKVGNAHHPLFDRLPLSRYEYPDFEKARDFYDVIYLTEKGQHRTRTPFLNMDCNLYGWDCECCLVLNPHVIGKQMPIKLK